MLIKLKNGLATQLLATVGVLLLMNQTGLTDGWTSPNMARLTQQNETLSLTLSEASWLVSCFQLGKFACVIIMPFLIELAGSRRTILCAFIPVSLSWLTIMFANSARWLYVARFLSGLTDGLAYGCYSIFIGEVSTPAHRGTFASIAMIGWPLGSLIATISETYLQPRLSSPIYLVPCLLGMFLLAWLPDSPYQLVKNQRIKEATESLSWYRGNKDVELEMKEIVDYVDSTAKVSISGRLQQLKSPAIRKALILVAVLNAYPDFCGVFNVIYYMQIILTGGNKSYLIEPGEVVIYTSVVQLIVTIVGVKLMDKLGRRILLMTSSVGICIAMMGLALHYYLENDSQVLSVISVILFVVAFTIGFGLVPSALVGEMFPIGVKSTAAMSASFATASVGFVSVKAYQPMIDAIGETYVFSMYAVFVAMAVPIVMFLLPETKGKSLREIQNDLTRNET